jgi:hypothetical protein
LEIVPPVCINYAEFPTPKSGSSHEIFDQEPVGKADLDLNCSHSAICLSLAAQRSLYDVQLDQPNITRHKPTGIFSISRLEENPDGLTATIASGILPLNVLASVAIVQELWPK